MATDIVIGRIPAAQQDGETPLTALNSSTAGARPADDLALKAAENLADCHRVLRELDAAAEGRPEFRAALKENAVAWANPLLCCGHELVQELLRVSVNMLSGIADRAENAGGVAGAVRRGLHG